MDKTRKIRALKMEEDDEVLFQYNENYYRITYSKEIYLLERKKGMRWSVVTSKANRMKLVPYIV